MTKNILKYAAGAIAIVAVAIGLLFLIDYIRYRTSPEYRATQALKELERKYAEDPYGGATPEETLQLFIDALKKGDLELASKYFVLDYQDESLIELKKINKSNNIQKMVDDISRVSYGKEIFPGHYQFTVVKLGTNVAQFTLNLIKNPRSLKWKLDKLF